MSALKILRNLASKSGRKDVVYTISNTEGIGRELSDKIVPGSMVTRGEALEEDMKAFRNEVNAFESHNR
jgi:hypothetical protein